MEVRKEGKKGEWEEGRRRRAIRRFFYYAFPAAAVAAAVAAKASDGVEPEICPINVRDSRSAKVDMRIQGRCFWKSHL